MAETVSSNGGKSPAARVMAEAIRLAGEERSPYPERAAFIDGDEPSAGAEIRRAADEGRAAVLVASNGSSTTLRPELTRG